MNIEIQISNNIDYTTLFDYHTNIVLNNSENTYNCLIDYTKKLIGICKLFLPETGIHISLQQKLIDKIIENKNITELIIFTNSPSIFGKGYADKIKFI